MLHRPLHIALLAVLSWCGVAHAESPAPPHYAAVLEQELTKIGVQPRCTREPDGRHRCTFTSAPAPAQPALTLHAVYSDETDTVYLYVERYLELPSDHSRAPAVLRRLMELNWEMLVGKFEWSARTGEVRISAVLNTDSNFDRRALRSTVRALQAVAARYLAELQALRGG